MLPEVPSKRLTHEILTTLMAEVAAIVNARPLVPVSSDPEVPEILTPATLLTQKPQQLKPPTGDFNTRDLYSAQWRRVQHLANIFWYRRRIEYLQTLQQCRKWQDTTRNLKQHDLVLLCSKDAPRNDWPLGRITSAQADCDGKVRKVDLVTTKDGSRKYFRRPITETILLNADEKHNEQWQETLILPVVAFYEYQARSVLSHYNRTLNIAWLLLFYFFPILCYLVSVQTATFFLWDRNRHTLAYDWKVAIRLVTLCYPHCGNFASVRISLYRVQTQQFFLFLP